MISLTLVCTFTEDDTGLAWNTVAAQLQLRTPAHNGLPLACVEDMVKPYELPAQNTRCRPVWAWVARQYIRLCHGTTGRQAVIRMPAQILTAYLTPEGQKPLSPLFLLLPAYQDPVPNTDRLSFPHLHDSSSGLQHRHSDALDFCLVHCLQTCRCNCCTASCSLSTAKISTSAPTFSSAQRRTSLTRCACILRLAVHSTCMFLTLAYSLSTFHDLSGVGMLPWAGPTATDQSFKRSNRHGPLLRVQQGQMEVTFRK